MKINLLPAELRPPRPLNLKDYLLATLVFFFFFTVTSYYNGIYSRVKSYEREIEENRRDLGGYAQVLEKRQRLLDEQANIEAKTNALAQLQSVPWSGFLAELGSLAPDGVTLEEVSGDVASGLVIRGRSKYLADLSQLLFGLGRSKYLQEVEFRSYSSSEFEIIAKVKPVIGGGN
jgi:hypothetical protein